MNQHHTIEIFSANCTLCKQVEEIIEAGKCVNCQQIVYDINSEDQDVKQKMKNYNVNSVPTTIVDKKFKVVGIPSFSLDGSENFFKRLEREYPMKKD